ncbi:protein of unknown function DUF125 [Macleaya cordata]|uniref:Vacuolar iron transporter n=1 Tax=Macleaya cordata TaxID=56857 RepID=A0A200Q714_MACCD|nr:protein of unknown function DUF125 [Macleaya cordata]
MCIAKCVEYLAAKSEADHYMRELKREQEEIINVPDTEAAEVEDILAQFELGLEKPQPRRALESAFTIAIAYVLGGLVPLLPYMFIPIARKAMLTSVHAGALVAAHHALVYELDTHGVGVITP